MNLRPGVRLLDRLASPFDADAYLSALNPRWGTRTRAVVASVTPVGVDAASVRLRPGAGWAGHRPGQFVTLGVDVGGVRHHRSFTVTSTPGERTVEVTVQAQPDGLVSRHLVRGARRGDVVQLSPAAGGVDAVDRDPGAPLLLVAGGSGVTPTIGILRSLDAAGVAVDAVVLHHATSPERALFTDELDRLAGRHPALTVHHVLSRPDGSHRLRADRLADRCPDWADRHAVVCGPEPMLDAATAIWADAGRAGRLHLERFHPAAPAAARPAHGEGADRAGRAPAVRFLRSDVVAAAPAGTTLLEVAERAGLAPPSGCRMGICHTCSTPLEAGRTVDVRDGRCSGAGDPVRLCVSTALDDLALDL